jgi:DNA-binding Lrp family transcriptional regulator
MVQAYVLIQTDSGRASEVASTIGDIGGVDSSEAVTGPYDVIVACQAADVDALGHLVVTQIQPVPGIVRTLTCPVIRLS